MSSLPKHQKDPLGPIALLLVAVGTVTMIFAGGCSLIVLTGVGPLWPIVLIYGGVPFLLGALTFWLATKYARCPPDTPMPEFDKVEP